MNGKHYEWDWFFVSMAKRIFIECGKKKDDIISSINFFLYLNNYM